MNSTRAIRTGRHRVMRAGALVCPLAWLPVVVAGLLADGAVAAPSARPAPLEWSRYQVILDREPFGSAPKAGEGGVGGDGTTGPLEETVVGPKLVDTIRLSVVTLYGGTPAAGFTDTASGRSFYLFEGESVEDYTLVAVDPAGAGVTLRKGTQEEDLQLGSPGAAPSATPPAGEVPVPGRTSTPMTLRPTDALSYAERQRQRAAEARQQFEESRRRADEERKSQEERVARLTGEAVQKHLREYALEAVRAGSSAAVPPIELTPEDVARLAAEGIDVNAEPAPPVTGPDAHRGPPGSDAVPPEDR